MTGIRNISFQISVRQDQSLSSSYQDKRMSPFQKDADPSAQQGHSVSRQMRDMIRDLNQTQKKKTNPFEATSKDKENGFLELSGSPDAAEDTAAKDTEYNFKEVSTKIQRAKTSQSAGQAYLSAKRKVQEIRRKLASAGSDGEALQQALIHARRIEMVARKKKHHLELEEMVERTARSDEKADRMEDAAVEMKNALITREEEDIAAKEDEIFEAREELLEELKAELEEGTAELSEEAMQQMNDMIASFGEDVLEELEDAMELLENMEIVDPHMSREDLEKLKTKHRNSEQKDIVKADMDYLKNMMKLSSPVAPGMGGIDLRL